MNTQQATPEFPDIACFFIHCLIFYTPCRIFGKIGVVIGSYFGHFVQKTLSCEKDKNGGLYFSAYALCVSRMVFYGLEDLGKISQSANRVYKKLHTQISDAEVNNEELAGLILSECKFDKFSEDNFVMRMFSVTKNKLKTLKGMMDGGMDG